jgi:hypothetical protein
MDRDSFVRPPSRGEVAAKERNSLRVATQYWKGEVRVCEIECAGQTLDIHISQPTGGNWLAEAHSDHSAAAVVIVGSGSSRSAALLDLAAGWSEKAPALGLHAFDWKAVTEALRAVNASD